MAFADEAAKPVVEGYTLARMTFQWLIDDASWSLSSANVYATTVPYSVASVTLNGAALTSTGSFPPNSGQYVYDRAGDLGPPNTVYVNDAGGTPNDATDNVVVVYYYQFASSGGDKRAFKDPKTQLAGDEDYVGRIQSAGPFNQSWENASFGVQTTSTSSISLLNADNWLQEHIASDRNIIGGEVKVWQVINATVATAFTGTIDSYAISGRTAQLSVTELTGRLNSLAFMGDDSDDAYIKSSYAALESTQPDAVGLPLKYICGRYGFTKYKYLGNYYELIDSEQAYAISYSDTISTATNRKWVLCRIPTSTFRTQVIGSVLAEYSAGAGTNAPFDWFVNFSEHNLVCGEWVKATNGGTDYFAIVVEIIVGGTSLSPGLTSYNVRLRKGAGFPSPSASTFIPLNKPTIMLDQNDPSAGIVAINPDFVTMAYTATSGGNYIATATIAANFTATVVEFGGAILNYETATSPLDPNNHKLFYLGIPSGSVTHGAAAQRILAGAGIAVDTSSITAADAALDANSAFTIPFYGESEFGTHRQYLQALAASTGAYVNITEDGEAAYNLIATPAAGTAIGDGDILAGSLSVSAAGGDVAHTIVASNIHMPTYRGTLGSDGDFSLSTAPVSSITENDQLAEAFRPNATTVALNHVLETVEDRIAYLLSLRSSPPVDYTFSTASLHAAAELGDDVTIETEQIPGGTVTAKIVSLTRDGKSTSVTARELP
jgi:hypothetical protein